MLVVKPFFHDANVKFLMCYVHVSTHEDTLRITCGHALAFQQSSEEKTSMDNSPGEHILVGFCSGLNLA